MNALGDLLEDVRNNKGTPWGRAARRVLGRKRKKLDARDIEARLNTLQEELETKRRDRACHAMLIAVKDTGTPEVRVWSIEATGHTGNVEKYLRVVF